jgi:hypothetical protein
MKDKKNQLEHNNINNIDVKNINVPELIRTSQYYQYTSVIKNYEDTLTKIFNTNKDSYLTNDPYIYTWKISKNADNNDLFPDIIDFNLNEFWNYDQSMNNSMNNIIITGPHIRSCFMGKYMNKSSDDTNCCFDKNVNIRNEIYLYKYTDRKWKDILNLENFTEKKSEYVLQDNNKKICLIKKTYKSPSHIILQHNYMKRVGYHNGSFLTSSMFLIDYQRHAHLIKSNYFDPVLNFPYDPFEIYISPKKDTTNILNLIEMVDHENLLTIPKKIFRKIYFNESGKTLIEICIDKLMSEQNPVVLNNLRQVIIYLSDISYKRPPTFYAKYMQLDNKDPELYQLINNISNVYELDMDFENIAKINDNINSIDHINNIVIESLVAKNETADFIDFLSYVRRKVDKDIINLIIKYNATNISSDLIKNNILNESHIYYLILLSQNIDMIKYLNTPFNNEIGLHFLKDVIENGLSRSFYFLYENNKTVIDTVFDNGQNILHIVKPVNNFKDVIRIIMKLKPEIINLYDDNKKTPVMYFAENYPIILNTLLQFDFDGSITDDNGNTFLHYLCKHDCMDTLRLCLKKYNFLIDLPNKKYETPSIISCKAKQEDMFYTLKGMGADLKSKDYYGNTVYHYICVNSICLGMMIIDTPNNFGFSPADYCKLSTNYYNFIAAKN